MFVEYYDTPAVREKWGAMPMAFSSGAEWRKPRHALQKDMFGTDEASSYLPAINEERSRGPARAHGAQCATARAPPRLGKTSHALPTRTGASASSTLMCGTCAFFFQQNDC